MGFRAKLITSYAALILVTLGLGVALFAFVVGQIQANATRDSIKRLQNITNMVSTDIARVRPNSQLQDYQSQLQFYANLLDVRIFLVDNRGVVQADTSANQNDNLTDKSVPGYAAIPRDGSAYQRTTHLNNVQYFYYARPGPNIQLVTAMAAICADSLPNLQTFVTTELWIAVPEADLGGNWNDVLKGFAGAALIALLISVGLAFVIARSIARPLIRMTRASSEIAQGHFKEQLPVKGRDEMARLAQSFNQMAGEVAQSQQTMRDFVANVSHELKTPLTSIQGYSQAIVEGVADDPDSLQHSAIVIYDEAARMRRLVDELLDLSRVESGQVELHRQRLNLNELLGRVLRRLEPLAASKGISLQSRLKDGLAITGDADRLEQIFTNILDNALKYGLPGSQVWVESLTEADQESAADAGRPSKSPRAPFAQIRIANLGPLIPPEQLPRIFERFYKLDPSRQRRGESTGLGLAITKELIEAQQGWINVTSRPAGPQGVGLTVFTVGLPLAGIDVRPQISDVSQSLTSGE